MQYRASRVVAGPFLHVLWRPEVTGLENIPETGGALLASNHLSILDSIFLPLVVSLPSRSRRSRSTSPVPGWSTG